MVILVDEGQDIIFGQFLGVHPRLGIMDYHPVYPGPEQPLSMANTVTERGFSSINLLHITKTEQSEIYEVSNGSRMRNILEGSSRIRWHFIGRVLGYLIKEELHL